jgi:DNA-binding NarL/FixJ family response regulator
VSTLSRDEAALLALWDAADGIATPGELARGLGVSAQRAKALLAGLVAKGVLDADEVGPLAPRKSEREHGHGLSPREEEIMNLADAGMEPEAIQRQLRIDLGYIRSTIRNYAFDTCWSNSARFEQAARIASAKLAAAIAATGRRFA